MLIMTCIHPKSLFFPVFQENSKLRRQMPQLFHRQPRAPFTRWLPSHLRIWIKMQRNPKTIEAIPLLSLRMASTWALKFFWTRNVWRDCFAMTAIQTIDDKWRRIVINKHQSRQNHVVQWAVDAAFPISTHSNKQIKILASQICLTHKLLQQTTFRVKHRIIWPRECQLLHHFLFINLLLHSTKCLLLHKHQCQTNILSNLLLRKSNISSNSRRDLWVIRLPSVRCALKQHHF